MDISLFFKILNFVLFAGLLGFLLRRPLKEFWRGRAEVLRERIGQAFKKRSVAETEYKNLMNRLNHLAQEIDQLVAQMRQNGELEKQRIIERATEYATKLEEAAGRIGRHETQKAQERLREETARQAVELASRLIEEKITPEDQRRLTKDYLDRLATEDLPLERGFA